VPPLPAYRFSVDQYHRLVEVGVLAANDPVELFEGLIVIKGQSTLVRATSIRTGSGRGTLSLLPIRRFTVAAHPRMIGWLEANHQPGIIGEPQDRQTIVTAPASLSLMPVDSLKPPGKS
jgi:hypothetical protein